MPLGSSDIACPLKSRRFLCPQLASTSRMFYIVKSLKLKELCHGDFADVWSKLF